MIRAGCGAKMRASVIVPVYNDGQLLAECLDRPHVGAATGLEVADDGQSLKANRRIEGADGRAQRHRSLGRQGLHLAQALERVRIDVELAKDGGHGLAPHRRTESEVDEQRSRRLGSQRDQPVASREVQSLW